MGNVTSDLSKFGYRELEIAIDILTVWLKDGLPEDFSKDDVSLQFNPHSGAVFLSNSEYQIAILTDGELALWYSCPTCGNEGFDGDDYPFRQYDGYCSAECRGDD